MLVFRKKLYERIRRSAVTTFESEGNDVRARSYVGVTFRERLSLPNISFLIIERTTARLVNTSLITLTFDPISSVCHTFVFCERIDNLKSSLLFMTPFVYSKNPTTAMHCCNKHFILIFWVPLDSPNTSSNTI